MIFSQKNSALILIDVQQGFDEPSWGKRNNPGAELNMGKLLNEWRENRRPIFHVKNDSTEANSPLRPEKPGNQIKDIVKPKADEPVIAKIVNSALIGTDLEKRLRDQKIDMIVLVGITTDHCVSTTARMAANLGFRVAIVSDATATFDRTSYDGSYHTAQEMHELALASLHGDFGSNVTTDDLFAK